MSGCGRRTSAFVCSGVCLGHGARNTLAERTTQRERLLERGGLRSCFPRAERWRAGLRTMAGCWQIPQSASGTLATVSKSKKPSYRAISTNGYVARTARFVARRCAVHFRAHGLCPSQSPCYVSHAVHTLFLVAAVAF